MLAGGNSNGDIEMLQFAGGPSRPGLPLLVLHDDPEREFDYVAGAERALEAAKAQLDGGERQARLGHRLRRRHGVHQEEGS